jgi:hypothetical protein
MEKHDTLTDRIVEMLAAAGLAPELTFDGPAEACPGCGAPALPSAA